MPFKLERDPMGGASTTYCTLYKYLYKCVLGSLTVKVSGEANLPATWI